MTVSTALLLPVYKDEMNEKFTFAIKQLCTRTLHESQAFSMSHYPHYLFLLHVRSFNCIFVGDILLIIINTYFFHFHSLILSKLQSADVVVVCLNAFTSTQCTYFFLCGMEAAAVLAHNKTFSQKLQRLAEYYVQHWAVIVAKKQTLVAKPKIQSILKMFKFHKL